jgi:hypothetical protein
MLGSLNTTNFVLGMALAKDLPRSEAATTGLAASQFPGGSILGPVLLKPLIDGRTEAEARAKRAEDQLAASVPSQTGASATLLGSGAPDFTKVLAAFSSRSSGLFGGGGGGGGGSGGSGAAFFAGAVGGDWESRDLRRQLDEKQAQLDDQLREKQRAERKLREENEDQMHAFQRGVVKDYEQRRANLEDEALAARRELQQEQNAAAARSADLDAREARIKEQEAAKAGKKY